MWASSRTGLRGFRVSLARTATKEDCIGDRLLIEVQFSASEVIPCYRRAKHGTTSPPPPPGREGYPLMWTILGCAAGQDTVFGLYRVWSVRSTFHFVFLS